MNNPFQKTSQALINALFSIWLIVSTIGFVIFDSNLIPLGLSVLAFVAVFSITGLFKYASWFASVIGIIAYAGASYYLYGFTVEALTTLGFAAAILIITAWLGSLINRILEENGRQLDNAHKLIEHLEIRDPQTGLVRYHFARQTLINEISRSQRYKNELSVLMGDAKNWDEIEKQYGVEHLNTIKRRISSIFVETLRDVDIPFSNGKWGAILPMTKLDGTLVVSRRLVDRIARETNVDFHIGIARVPTDGISDEEIIQASEAALKVAITSDEPLAQYNLIKKVVMEETE